MIKRTLTAIAAGAILAAGLSLTGASSASAAAANPTPGCMTRHEYDRTRIGWTPQHVARVAGTNGHTLWAVHAGRHQQVVKTYRICANPYDAPGTRARFDYRSHRRGVPVKAWSIRWIEG
jgi:hypothetical protein